MPLPADIVLVTDDVAVGSALRFRLQVKGLTVRLYLGSTAALAAPDSLSSRCIVVEDSRPRLDGAALVEMLRAQDVATPVIMITGCSDEGLRNWAAGLGTCYILEMPILGDDLLETILLASAGS